MGSNLHSCRGTRIAPTRMEWAFQDQDSAIVQRRSISDSERLDVARRRIRAVVVATTELVAVAKEWPPKRRPWKRSRACQRAESIVTARWARESSSVQIQQRCGPVLYTRKSVKQQPLLNSKKLLKCT